MNPPASWRWGADAWALSCRLAISLGQFETGEFPEEIAKEENMPTIIEPSKGKAPQIDDGLYTVTCRGVKSVTVDNDQFGNFEKIEVALEVEGAEDEDGNPLTLDPRCNRKWNEKATLFQWAQAFGVVASTNEAFDADDLIGKRAQALIETPEDGGWPRVTKMTALKKGSAKAATPAPTAAAVPSIINPDGSVDFDTFWKTLRAHNISRSEVVAQVNGDIENLMAMEAADVALLLESLLNVPF